MKKSYLFAPLLALLVFAALFVRFCRSERIREQTRIVQLEADFRTKRVAETEARRQAVIEAVRVQADLKKQLAARKESDRVQQESRKQAVAVRDQALREQQGLTRQLEIRKQELLAEQSALTQLTASHNTARVEQEFLLKIVAQSEANVKALAAVIATFPPSKTAYHLGVAETPVAQKTKP